MNPMTIQPARSSSNIERSNLPSLLTDIKNPPKSNGFNNTSVVEALYPQSKCETSPSANAVPCSLPKEDGDGSTGDTSNYRGEYKHATKRLAWRVDRGEYTKLEN
jgi:hypothetical protein